MAKLLSSDCIVIIVLLGQIQEKIFEDILSSFKYKIESEKVFYKHKQNHKLGVVKEACLRENKYGTCYSMIISQDRNLWKGFIVDATKVPNFNASWWSYEEKLEHLLKEFNF